MTSQVKNSRLHALLEQNVGKSFAGGLLPFSAWLAGTIEAVGTDSVTVSFVVRAEMTNPGGILHGGVMAAMIDDLIGLTVNAFTPDAFFVSINLSVDYLSSARAGDKVVAQARTIRQGQRVVNAECELRRADGVLLARGSSNLIAANREA